MAPKLLRIVLMVFIGAAGSAAATSLQELPKCASAKVNYTKFDDTYASKFMIEHPRDSKTSLPSGKKAYSPQHTRWLIEVRADYMKPGPLTTRFYLGSGESQTDLVLTALEHGNSISAQWLNEKLLFGQVWWGRIYSTDFIFDVEQGKFIYREMAHYGDLIEPCQ